MTFWVLPHTCCNKQVLALLTVSSLTEDKLTDPAVQARMAELEASIREKIGDSVSDAEVDPVVAAMLPSVPDKLLFLEEEVNTNHSRVMLLCRKLTTTLRKLTTSTFDCGSQSSKKHAAGETLVQKATVSDARGMHRWKSSWVAP
jgi:hypothetical protein